MKAMDVMKSPVVTVSEDTSVTDVVALLLDKHVSGVPVVNGAGRVIGMVSEGDLMRRPELDTDRRPRRLLSFLTGDTGTPAEYLRTHARTAGELMRKPVISVAPNAALNDVVTAMESNGVKRVPVIESGRLVGIVTRSDLLRALAHTPVPENPAQHSDRKIREDILAALDSESWSRAALLNVIVVDGKVSLWGVMEDDEHRDAIHRMVESVPGVVSVEDCMRGQIYYG